jgi:hypothetical protein
MKLLESVGMGRNFSIPGQEDHKKKGILLHITNKRWLIQHKALANKEPR